MASGALGSGLVGCSPQEGSGSSPGLCASETSEHAEARLLTRSEYLRTVQDLLGTTLDPTKSFPPEPVVGGFENDASSHQANPLLVEKHADAAAQLADDLLTRGVGSIYSCDDADSPRECAETFIEHFGTRAYRRPLSPEEKDSFLKLYDQVSPSFGHEQGLAAVVEAALQAPQFLYRVEAPIATANDDDVVLLGPYEIASRLSYFLWGTMPDDELLEAAAQHGLGEKKEVAAQARRLVADSRAEERAREFHSQWLGLSRLDSIARDDAPPEAAGSWRESTHRFIDSVLWGEDPTTGELFSSPVVYFDEALAKLYGFDPPSGWTHEDAPSERAGLLTQPGMMALYAHSDQSSPIQRGVFVRENILCEDVEPPPPTIDNNPPDPDPNLTTRERFRIHTESPACANCHRLIDPMGFGFEAYDHLGRFRTLENDLPIDTSGEIVEVQEDPLEGEFDDAAQLSERISKSQTALSCMAKKWYTFAAGRAYSQSDSCSVDAAVSQAKAHGGDMRELLVALASSDAFRYRSAHESDRRATAP